MKPFIALSRLQHAVLDIATPAFCALLWLGNFPDSSVIVISLLTAFSGYTAIYALNDVIGYTVDKKKMEYSNSCFGYSVESTDLRHPIAQQVLSYTEGVAWVMAWIIFALIGAYWLNPIIMLMLLFGAVCEVAYCKLLTVTHWRLVLSGIVKSVGPIAAVFVVDHNPDPLFLALIFMWVFFWEIGGQNIPADWNDRSEDIKVNAKTIPLIFGDKTSKKIVLLSLLLATLLSGFLLIISPLRLGLAYLVLSALIGVALLIWPAIKLYLADTITDQPARLFDLASYYPLALLLMMVMLIYCNNYEVAILDWAAN